MSHIVQAGLKSFVTEEGLKLLIYLVLPPKCWAHKQVLCGAKDRTRGLVHTAQHTAQQATWLPHL